MAWSSALLIHAPAALAEPDTAAVSVGGAQAGRNDLYTGPQLAAMLDNGSLSDLRTYFPSSASSTDPVFPYPMGTASGMARVEHKSPDERIRGLSSLNLGATVSAVGYVTHPPNIYTQAEGFVYAQDTLGVAGNASNDVLVNSLLVHVNLEGHVEAYGDALVEVGAVLRITDALGKQYTAANTWTYSSGTDLYFGTAEGSSGSFPLDPLKLFVFEPMNSATIFSGGTFFDPNFMTTEELLYVRSTVGLNGGTGTATADFYNTMAVSNIQLLDPDGQVIPDLTLTGVNGDTYPYNVPLAIPEPTATSAVILFGVASLAARRRRPR